MSDIFLSYSKPDLERLRPLVKVLEAQGWTVFWDRKIPVGKSWRSFIRQEIQNCLCMVVVWSEDSVKSEWVMEEAEEGKSRHILFPASLDNTKPPFGFGTLQVADLTGWKGKGNHSGFKLLVDELENHIREIKQQKVAAVLNPVASKKFTDSKEEEKQSILEGDTELDKHKNTPINHLNNLNSSKVFPRTVWVLFLLVATIGLLFLEKFLITSVSKEPLWYLSAVLPSVSMILGVTMVLTGISRLSTYRWEIVPAISIASLMFLIPQVFDYIGHYLSYLFTSDSIAMWLKYFAKFLIIPFLLAVFIVKTIHARWRPAIVIAYLVYSPFIALQLQQVIENIVNKSGFTSTASYSQVLIPSDTRLNTSISLDEFIKEADKYTEKQVKEMLKREE